MSKKEELLKIVTELIELIEEENVCPEYADKLVEAEALINECWPTEEVEIHEACLHISTILKDAENKHDYAIKNKLNDAQQTWLWKIKVLEPLLVGLRKVRDRPKVTGEQVLAAYIKHFPDEGTPRTLCEKIAVELNQLRSNHE